MVPVENQIYVFFITILLGFLVGIIFDFYETLRFFIRLKRLLAPVDFLLWVLITIITFIVLFEVNSGEVRFYVFIGIGTGFLFYRKLCSKYIRFIFYKIITIILLPFQKLFLLILRPVGLLKSPFNVVRKKIKELYKRIFTKFVDK